MSARRSKVVKSTRFASKFVGEVADHMIEQRVQASKYPVATHKWMGKMKNSILHKISARSKILFQKEGENASQLRGQITALIVKIQGQRSRIEQMLVAQGKATEQALAQRIPAQQSAYKSGQFEASASRIQEQFNQVATLLQEIPQKVATSSGELENTLNAVNKQLPGIEPELQKKKLEASSRNPTASAGAGTSAVSTRHTTAGSSSANNSAAAKKGGVTYGATAKDTMQQMQRHLGKK